MKRFEKTLRTKVIIRDATRLIWEIFLSIPNKNTMEKLVQTKKILLGQKVGLALSLVSPVKERSLLLSTSQPYLRKLIMLFKIEIKIAERERRLLTVMYAIRLLDEKK